MENFETQPKAFENVQKRTGHAALHPFFLSGETFTVKQAGNDNKRKTKETGRAISLFLLKMRNSRG